MKKKKTIAFLFIFSISIMLGHGFIPHHHHSHIAKAQKENHCTESDFEHHENSDEPYHCHAFNNTNWYENAHTELKKQTEASSIIIDFLLAQQSNPELKAYAFYLRKDKLLKNPFLINTSPLRGPPFIS